MEIKANICLTGRSLRPSQRRCHDRVAVVGHTHIHTYGAQHDEVTHYDGLETCLRACNANISVLGAWLGACMHNFGVEFGVFWSVV